ncbi:MAG: IS110 family transposase [Anaerolineaceae bacterium]|nr:IS110 family transposase [Anaerolineaceae bacterium]MBK8904189.1 IS110 family transposase [Anaerolineaceae bacterium]
MFTTSDLLVGVDIHRRNNVVQVMNGVGDSLAKPQHVANNRPGTAALIQQLADLAQAGGFAHIHIAAEATGNYWLPFFCELEQSPELAAWPVSLYPFNPKVIHKFRHCLGDWDKTDTLDALVIAERLRLGRQLPYPFQMEERYLPLRTLTRYRYHLVGEVVRVKSYALSLVYLQASDYTVDRAFSDVFGKTSQAVLKEFPSLEAVAAMPFDDLVEWLDVKGKRRFADPQDNARRLHRIAQDSYHLPEPWLAAVNTALSLSLRHLTVLEQLLTRLDSAIADLMTQIPNSLTTIPGIGPVFAAGIIAEIGDLARFDYRHEKVASFAGLKWSKHQSADFTAEETHLKRTGSAYLRYYLCEAAQLVRMHDAEYGAFYQKKHDEVRHHQHKRAIVLTARKLVRLVVRLLTTHEPFRARQVPTG